MSPGDETLRALLHDLRAPQSAILALLRNDAQRRGGAGEVHERIALQAEKTLALIDALALQLRADSDSYALQDVELGQLLHELRERVLPQAKAGGVALALMLEAAEAGEEEEEDEGFWVRADPRLLEGALHQLVYNAIHHSPQGATIRMTLAWRGKRPTRGALITLRQPGPFVAAKDPTRCFERIPGHGLGFGFVKTVVERHAGTIACTSRPARGSRFVIALPEAPPEDS
jgi:signal transduction histidine kinase